MVCTRYLCGPADQMLAQWVLTIEWSSTGARWLARLMGSFFLLALRRPAKKNIEEENTSSRWCLQTMVSKHQWLGKAILLPNVKSNCQLGEWIRGKWSYFINPTLDWGSELSGLGTLDLSYFDSRWLPTAWINSSIISIHPFNPFISNKPIKFIQFVCFRFGLNSTNPLPPAIQPSIRMASISQATKRYKGCESQVRSCGWDLPSRFQTWVENPPILRCEKTGPVSEKTGKFDIIWL